MTKVKNPRLELKYIDPVKVYNSLHIVDTSGVKFPTNYYQLTPEQRQFVDGIMFAVEDHVHEVVEQYNEDIGYVEADLNDD